MKKIFSPTFASSILLGFLMLTLFSCQKDFPFSPVQFSDECGAYISFCGDSLIEDIYKHPHIKVGTTTVGNDTDSVYVKFNFIPGALEDSTPIYVYAGENIHEDSILPDSSNLKRFLYLTDIDQCYILSFPKDSLPDTCLLVGVYVDTDPDTFLVGNLNLLWFCPQECSDGGDTPPCFEPGDFRTQTQGGWGTTAHGNNPGTYRDAHFDDAFPDGLVIGDPDNYTLTLTNSKAVEDFLPSGTTPRALDNDYVDPARSYRNNFASQIVALTLSVGFDYNDPGFGGSDTNLGDLIFDGGTFDGMTVAEVLHEANIALGGGDTDYSIQELHSAITSVNEAFVDGKKNNGKGLFKCE